MKFEDLIKQVSFLDLNKKKLRASYRNLLAQDYWWPPMKMEQQFLGIAYVITTQREKEACPENCSLRGNPKKCLLMKAIKRAATDFEILNAVHACPYSKPINDFVQRYCQKSKLENEMKRQMKKAYEDWKTEHQKDIENKSGMKPLFPGDYSVKPRKRKRKRPKKLNSNLKLEPLFNDRGKNNSSVKGAK